MHLPLPRSNRRPRPDSPVRVALAGKMVSKARAVPVDRVCLAVSRVRMVSRVCPVARGVLAGKMASKAKVAPVDRVCLAASKVRMASRVCPAVRVAPADRRVRVVRALRTDPPRRDPRTQLQRRRRQKTLLKALTPKTLIPLPSNEELPVGVLDATMAPGCPYFFS